MADDADKNKTLTYSLDGPNDYKELVNLNSHSGELVVANKIDRETYDWLNFTVSQLYTSSIIRKIFFRLNQWILEFHPVPQGLKSLYKF